MNVRHLKGRHLFIDDAWVAQMENIAFTVNPPQKMGRALRPDRPWDATSVCVNTTVIDGDECRLYYVGRDRENRGFLCLALSTDGVKWHKPDLGVFSYEGSKKNNILFEDERISGTVFVDPCAPKKERYKFLHADGLQGAWVRVSPDGVRFRKINTCLMPFYLDNHISALWDDRLQKCVVYMRGWSPSNDDYRWMGFRNIARAETKDITRPWRYRRNVKKWSLSRDHLPVVDGQLPCVLARDEQDAPTVDIYNMSAVKYPFSEDAYLAFPSIYYRYPFPPEGQYINHGFLDIQLAVSRGGISWKRFREPYVEGGIHGEGDWARLHMGVGLVFRGNYLYQYYRGLNLPHGQGRTGLREFEPPPSECRPSRNLGLGRLAQRVDGFVSADAAYTGGRLVTKPFVFTGNRLKVNLNTTAAGDMQIGILNRANRPMRGYSAEDCDLVQGNFVGKEISWLGDPDVSSLAGKQVRLEFRMRGGKLYAFEFVAAQAYPPSPCRYE